MTFLYQSKHGWRSFSVPPHSTGTKDPLRFAANLTNFTGRLHIPENSDPWEALAAALDLELHLGRRLRYDHKWFAPRLRRYVAEPAPPTRD
jgi:hypothetical protein